MTLTPARTRLALLALALGGFGIGTTEFVAMGLLPEMAADLLPELYAASPEEANGQAGLLIAAYALGVVVGAPTIAATSSRFPRRTLLLALIAAFTVGTLASALLPDFTLVLAARFAAALPHGAYFGIASLVAADLMGPGKRGQGIALVLSGLTIANVIGVPTITYLGQVAGWRVAYVAVAVLFALTFVAVRVLVPWQPGDRTASVARELGALRRSQVWFALAIGAVGFGGFFAVYSYVAPLVTETAGLDAVVVPAALVTVGVGMTVGNLMGGWFADRGVMRAMAVLFPLFGGSLLGIALTASSPIGLFGFLFAIGFTGSALAPAVQTRLLDVSGESKTLPAALNHSAFNAGNSLGAYLGGLVIAAGFGYAAPAWVGLALAVLGAGIAVASAVAERRSGRAAGVADEQPAAAAVREGAPV